MTNARNIFVWQNKLLFTFLLFFLFIYLFEFELYFFYCLSLSKMPVWDCTICISKCFELYSKNLGTSSMWVSSMLNDYLCERELKSPMMHHSSLINCICIVTVWCCVWEWRVSHLLCPISRQPVQFCESAACFWGCLCKRLQKREMSVCVCACMRVRVCAWV